MRIRCLSRSAPAALALVLPAFAFALAAAPSLAAPLAAQQAGTPGGTAADTLGVTAQELGGRLRELSSDRFLGRFPGTPGETLTTDYLISRLDSFGLRPGAGSAGGGWLQPVAMLTHQADSASPNEARLSGRISRSLEHGREVRLANHSAAAEVRTGGELVFVGYGIDAPVYQWHDFAGTDMRGKIAVMLVGEPTLEGDSVRFNGVRASRYSWLNEKLGELGRRGAVGVLLVRPAGSLSRSPVAGTRRLAADVPPGQSLRFTGLLADSTLAALLPVGAPALAEVLAAAARPGFRALPLGVRLDVRFRTRPSTVLSHNVIAVVPGSDARLAAEHVVLSAHWDAFGTGSAVAGDSIYNGALDDASGVSSLLAVARVLARHPQRRSITFLFTTAEEWGLLGARAYVCDGPVAPGRIAANLNVDDGIELFGVKRDAAPLGVEFSTLGRTVADVAAGMGLRVSPDPYPEEGFFLRADNFPFARMGVPALYMALGTDVVGQPAGWVDARVQEYLERHYHRPSDEYDTVVVDLEGARQMAEFVRDVTLAVANADERPRWLPDAEFQRPAEGAARCAR